MQPENPGSYVPKLKPQRLKPKHYGKTLTTVWEKTMILRTLEMAAEEAKKKEIGKPWFVEVGTFRGETAMVVIQAINDLGLKSHFRTIDIAMRKRYHSRFRNLETKLPIVDGKWLTGTSASESGSIGDPLLWLFIDGCHCTDCVKRDIEIFVPRLVPGGIVLFHDANDVYKSMETTEVYHGAKDDEKTWRRVGVIEAIRECSDILSGFELLEASPPKVKRSMVWFGGMHVYQRK